MADLSMKHTIHWCRRCLGHFDNSAVVRTHEKYCDGFDSSGQLTHLPHKSILVKFENELYVASDVP